MVTIYTIKTQLMNCSICDEEIKGQAVKGKDGFLQVPHEEGNDAHPVSRGKCCDECNHRVVMPARLLNSLLRQE